MSLQTLYFAHGPLPVGTDILLWPAFVKIDGHTAEATTGKLIGTATVSGTTTGSGALCHLEAGSSVAVPDEIAHWSDQVLPIALPADGDVGGIVGVALVLIESGPLESDALLAGHEAFNAGLQKSLNDMIDKHSGLQGIGSDEVATLVQAVQDSIEQAIMAAAAGLLDGLHEWLDGPQHAAIFAYFSQDELPLAEFDQKDFDPASNDGPTPVRWIGSVPEVIGFIGLTGAISRWRRAVGQGVLRTLAAPVRSVAGFTSPDGYQHAIAATSDGELTEIYWQGAGAVGSGFLTRFTSQIMGLAGYTSTDGYQQAIVATEDGALTEVYWHGSAAPSQGALSHFDSRIVAIAGYSSADGYQHVIVATEDGSITEVYWLTGQVGRGTLSQLNHPVVDLAGYEAGGTHHVIAATTDGRLTELTWSGGASPSLRTYAQLEAHPWNHVLGVGAYDAGQEQHVIVAMSNGTLREFHSPSGESAAPPHHTDLAAIPGMVPIIDAYAETDGTQHAIAATSDGAVHELWWTPGIPLGSTLVHRGHERRVAAT